MIQKLEGCLDLTIIKSDTTSGSLTLHFKTELGFNTWILGIFDYWTDSELGNFIVSCILIDECNSSKVEELLFNGELVDGEVFVELFHKDRTEKTRYKIDEVFITRAKCGPALFKFFLF